MQKMNENSGSRINLTLSQSTRKGSCLFSCLWLQGSRFMFQKKCIVCIYLLKAIFLLQWNFRDSKLKQIEGAKMLASPIPQNATSLILQSVNIFYKISYFFCFKSKDLIKWSKNYKKSWSDKFWLQRYQPSKDVQNTNQ